LGSGINYKEQCVDINIDGVLLNMCSDVKYLDIIFC